MNNLFQSIKYFMLASLVLVINPVFSDSIEHGLSIREMKRNHFRRVEQIRIDEERQKLLNENNEIKEKYKGLRGLVKYAQDYYNNNIERALANVSLVLSEKELKASGYEHQYKQLRSSISTSNVSGSLPSVDGSKNLHGRMLRHSDNPSRLPSHIEIGWNSASCQSVWKL